MTTQAITFNSAPYSEFGPAKVGVLGAPMDFGATTYGSGQGKAPRGIRLSYKGPTLDGLVDLGDVDVLDRSLLEYLNDLAGEVNLATTAVERMVVLGGDDSVSYGVLKGLKEVFTQPLGLIHFDAHHDSVDSPRLDHASWVAHAVKDGYVSHISRIGTREPHGLDDIAQHVHDAEMKEPWPEKSVIVVDMDWFDPSCAPGVATAEPGGVAAQDGMSKIRDAITLHDPVALVITEVVPDRDINDMTQRLAFRIAYDYCELSVM